MKETGFEPQKRYAKKQVDGGMVRVSAWIPEDSRAKALAYMAKLRNSKPTVKQGA